MQLIIPIPLWGVTTPGGHVLTASLSTLKEIAIERFAEEHLVGHKEAAAYWEKQQAKGYQLQQFTLSQESPHE